MSRNNRRISDVFTQSIWENIDGINDHLDSYPIFNYLEEKTSIPKLYIAAAFLLIGGMFIFYGLASSVVCSVVGLALPLYHTLANIENAPRTQRKHILAYWLCYLLFLIVSPLVDAILSWAPLYYIAKLVFLLYLYSPSWEGASIIYAYFLKPLLYPQMPQMVKYLDATDRISSVTSHRIRTNISQGYGYKLMQIRATCMRWIHEQEEYHLSLQKKQPASQTSYTVSTTSTSSFSSIESTDIQYVEKTLVRTSINNTLVTETFTESHMIDDTINDSIMGDHLEFSFKGDLLNDVPLENNQDSNCVAVSEGEISQNLTPSLSSLSHVASSLSNVAISLSSAALSIALSAASSSAPPPNQLSPLNNDLCFDDNHSKHDSHYSHSQHSNTDRSYNGSHQNNQEHCLDDLNQSPLLGDDIDIDDMMLVHGAADGLSMDSVDTDELIANTSGLKLYRNRSYHNSNSLLNKKHPDDYVNTTDETNKIEDETPTQRRVLRSQTKKI